MNAGATPNETMSASESYSTPNWLVAFMRRATRPSSMSMIMATKIASVASVYRPSTVSSIAKKPQKRLPVVSRLGSRKMLFRRRSRSSCHGRRRSRFVPWRRGITAVRAAGPSAGPAGPSEASL